MIFLIKNPEYNPLFLFRLENPINLLFFEYMIELKIVLCESKFTKKEIS